MHSIDLVITDNQGKISLKDHVDFNSYKGYSVKVEQCYIYSSVGFTNQTPPFIYLSLGQNNHVLSSKTEYSFFVPVLDVNSNSCYLRKPIYLGNIAEEQIEKIYYGIMDSSLALLAGTIKVWIKLVIYI